MVEHSTFDGGALPAARAVLVIGAGTMGCGIAEVAAIESDELFQPCKQLGGALTHGARHLAAHGPGGGHALLLPCRREPAVSGALVRVGVGSHHRAGENREEGAAKLN